VLRNAIFVTKSGRTDDIEAGMTKLEQELAERVLFPKAADQTRTRELA